MSEKNSNFSSDYDIDNAEYRELFHRIETSSKKYSEVRGDNPGKKKEYVPKAIPKVNEKLSLEGFGSIVKNAKTAFNSGKKVIKNKQKHDLPLLAKLYKASVVIFAVFLVFFGFLSMVDKNKTVSEQENRKLAEKPKFTFSSLFSGEYTVAFENFYSDNFPMRGFFINCNTKINDVFTRFSGENGDVVVSTEKHDSDFVGEGVDLLGEKKKQGMKENTAAVTPDSEATVSGSILITGQRALEIYTHNDTSANRYASVINKTAKSMPKDVKFYSMLCPTAVEFYGTAKYREGQYSQRESIKKIDSLLDKSIIKVDAYSNLVDAVDDYIYFRSDHHWTARGAYCGYKAFCDVSGNSAPALESFTTHNIDGFLGSLYKATYSSVLSNNPDSVECFELAVDAMNIVYPDGKMNPSEGVSTYVVASQVNDSNKYLAFIAGDQPVEKIVTSVKNGKKILVIKESFGNAFVPFLCNNYEEIYVVDPRWVEMNLADFVTTNGIQEVLAINYIFATSNNTYCSALSKMSDPVNQTKTTVQINGASATTSAQQSTTAQQTQVYTTAQQTQSYNDDQ